MTANAPRVFASAADLLAAVGVTLGPGEWFGVDQARVDAFAVATADEQWIHVDVARAASGPFGGTIAHGYLMLSLVPMLMEGMFSVQNATMSVNYGLDRVRFVQPVRVGKRVRATGVVVSAEESRVGVRFGLTVTVAIEGEAKPALVAETIAVFAF